MESLEIRDPKYLTKYSLTLLGTRLRFLNHNDVTKNRLFGFEKYKKTEFSDLFVNDSLNCNFTVLKKKEDLET